MDQTSLIQEALTTAKTILVTLPKGLTLDKVASALAMFLSCQKIPKSTTVVCEQALTVAYSHLVGVEKITDKLGGRNLVVSFDYQEDSIEKVSYHIENGQFNLVVQPKEGKLPLATDKVKYRYAGGGADLVINFEREITELDKLYQENKEALDKAKVINLALGSAASYAEIVAEILSRLRLPVDEDIAQNLWAGLQEATHNFTAPGLTANTFEAAAFCLRSGAKLNQGENKRPVSSAEKIEQKESPITPPPDWLEPKIYRGTQV